MIDFDEDYVEKEIEFIKNIKIDIVREIVKLRKFIVIEE